MSKSQEPSSGLGCFIWISQSSFKPHTKILSKHEHSHFFLSLSGKGLYYLDAVLCNSDVQMVPLSMGTVLRWKGYTGIQV